MPAEESEAHIRFLDIVLRHQKERGLCSKALATDALRSRRPWSAEAARGESEYSAWCPNAAPAADAS